MRQKTKYIIHSILGIAVVIKVAQLHLLTPLITDAFQGEAFGYLNELLNKHRLKDPDNRTLSYYISKATDYTNRFLLIYLIASLFIYWLGRYHKRTIKTFFTKPAPATNLAVFRIFFFGYLLYLGFPKKASAVSYLGQEALVPPPGWHLILNHIPIEPLSIYFLGTVFKISCIFGLIGLYSRTAALFAAISGLWIMGVPEFFGKVDHYLWQFLLILGFSRCGDALSVDIIIRSIKNPFQQFQQKSSAYRTPLVFIWITIGLIYFFSGLWKFVFSGFEWAYSDNLKYKMYAKWIELDNWAPLFRIDYYPWLYKPAALSVILFELSFIFALPFRISRIIIIWCGLIFHSMTWLFMKISFAGLLVMYTGFINWDKLFKKAGRLFIKPVYLSYNTQNIYSVQIKSVIEQVDIFNAVTFKKSSEKLSNTQSLITGTNSYFRWPFLLQLVLRVPLILVASPFIGFILLCHIVKIKSIYPKHFTLNIQANYNIIIVGLLVISLNCFTGLAIINSWPFSIYPTFASIETEYTSTIMMAAYDRSDNLEEQTIPLVSSNNSFVTHFQNKSRLRGFIGHILNSTHPNNQDYELLLNLWLDRNQNLQTIQSIKFYQIQLSMNPDKEYEDYKLNKLLYQKEL